MDFPGPPELLIILVVVLVLFGGKKLPELARSLGKAKKEYQEGLDEDRVGHHAEAVTASATNVEPTALPDAAPTAPVDDTGTVAQPPSPSTSGTDA